MNSEITFKDIFTLLKKSFVRIVVYVLIAAILVGAIGLVVILVTDKDDSYHAVIQFNYKNAEDGLDPWGRRLDVSKIKADNIVVDALTSLGYDQERIAELKPELISNITISGMVPEDAMTKILTIKEIATKNPTALDELNSLSYVSTNYVVALQSDSKLKLSKDEYKAILNSVIDTYINKFRETYGFGNLLGTKVAETVEYEKYDYIQIYSLLESQINEAVSYLDNLISDAKDFRSTESKLSFFDLREKAYKIINYELSFLETYIMENGIQKSGSNNAAKLYIEERIRYLQDSISLYQDRKTSTEAAIAIFEHQYNSHIDTNGNITNTLANGDVYQQLFNDLTNNNAKLAELNSTLVKWQRWKDKFDAPGGEGDPEVADEMVEEVNVKIISLLGQINDTVDEYISTEVLKNSVVRAVAAVKAEKEDNVLLIMFLVEAVAVLIAAIAAVSVTKKKGNDLSFKKSTAAEPAADNKAEEEKTE